LERRAVSGIMLTLLLISMSTLAFNIQLVKSEPRTLTVDDDGPADFSSIQEAINTASRGDTIFVHSGTYYENVVVNKTVSLIGENWNTTVVEGVVPHSMWQSVIAVPSDLVAIANFTVTNGINGIYLRGRRSTVTDCVAYENTFGLTIDPNIAFGYSTNVLRRNQLFNNTYNLFVLGAWYFNDYVQDIDSSNLVNGKPVYYLVDEENISITPETYPNIGYLGIVGSTNVQIANLSLSRNGDGLLVAFSQNTLIENVEATYNFNGISLMNSPQTIVNHCNFSYNFLGAFLYYSDGVNIKENNISYNEEGIFLMASNNNEICHNNFIENYRFGQVVVDQYSYTNHWDDGYPSGGNYWSDHVTVDNYSGINQDELGSDGIVDEPYIIDGHNQDNYPLMEPWTPLPPIPTTLYELKTKVEELGSEDEIDNKGIVKSLMAKLNVAQKLVDKGKVDEVEMVLEGFIMQVQELSGIHITVEAADILIQSAEYILSHL